DAARRSVRRNTVVGVEVGLRVRDRVDDIHRLAGLVRRVDEDRAAEGVAALVDGRRRAAGADRVDLRTGDAGRGRLVDRLRAGAGLLGVLPGLAAVSGVPELHGGVVARVVAGRADDSVPAVVGPGERRLAVGRAGAHADGGEAEPSVGRRTVARGRAGGNRR